MDTDKSEGESGLDHDPAFRQGARIRHRVPAGLGGRPVPASARARRPGPRRARGGAATGACRADARAPAREDLFRRQPAHARPVVVQRAVALPRRAAGSRRRDHGIQGQLLLLRQHRRFALRRDDPFRLELRHAGMAARAGARPRRLRGGFGDKGGFRRRRRYAARDVGTDDASVPSRVQVRTAAFRRGRPRARFRSPSKASWSPSPPAPSPISRSASACFTRNSATATSPPSTATSSPSRSTRPARNGWWTVSWSGCEMAILPISKPLTVFIDANVLLSFYSYSNDDLEKLLHIKSLVSQPIGLSSLSRFSKRYRGIAKSKLLRQSRNFRKKNSR